MQTESCSSHNGLRFSSASEMTYIVSGGALNSTHSLTHVCALVTNSFYVGPLQRILYTLLSRIENSGACNW